MLSLSNGALVPHRPITASSCSSCLPRHLIPTRIVKITTTTSKAASNRSSRRPVVPARPRPLEFRSTVTTIIKPALHPPFFYAPGHSGQHRCFALSSSTIKMPATFENSWIGHKGAAGYDLRSESCPFSLFLYRGGKTNSVF